MGVDKETIPAPHKILLAQGLKFIPQMPIDTKKVSTELSEELFNLLHRLLKKGATTVQKNKYYSKENKITPDITKLNLANTVTEKQIQLYINKAYRKEFIDGILQKFTVSMSRFSRQAVLSPFFTCLRALKHSNYIFKPTDKNLGIACIDKEWYHLEIQKHLEDERTYKKVTEIPKTSIEELNILASTTNSQLKRFLLKNSSDPKPAPFYILPKVHKTPVSSRPIAADHSTLCSNLSKLLSDTFNSITQYPWIIRNSKQITDWLDSNVIGSSHLICTADVEALYPNMHSLHIRAMNIVIKTFLKNGFDADGNLLSSDFLIKAFHTVLNNHFIIYNEQIYQQISGTAMGTAMAPPYANLALAYLETPILNKYSSDIILYGRYIDDIIVIWSNTIDTLRTFQNELQQRLQLKLTWTEPGNSCDYLDLHIFKGDRFNTTNLLDYRTHQKTVNRYLYTPLRSNHPEHQLTGMIIGELKRYARTNSSVTTFQDITDQFFQRLIARGFPADKILNIIGPRSTRVSLYNKLRQPGPTLTLTPKRYFVSTFYYNKSADIVRAILKNSQIHDTRISFKVQPSLRNKLIQATMSNDLN